MHEPNSVQLERSPTTPSLAPQATGLAAAPDCPGVGGQRGRDQSVDGPGPRYRSRGAPASPAPGAPRRLSAEPLARLPALLHRGPTAYGFRGELWTRTRVAAIIRLEFGVSYHPRHVGRLLAVIRWSPQKPARRARQRDDLADRRDCCLGWPVVRKCFRVGGRDLQSVREAERTSRLRAGRELADCRCSSSGPGVSLGRPVDAGWTCLARGNRIGYSPG
jgi:hypothetical protein